MRIQFVIRLARRRRGLAGLGGHLSQQINDPKVVGMAAEVLA